MGNGAISRSDILKTLDEYDELGREVFLRKYGYRKAHTYILVYEGKEYDSKAIAGVAHKYRYGEPLTPQDLSGGVGHAVDWLIREGFTVEAVHGREWTRDELILICDQVARNEWKDLAMKDPRIAELCDLLSLLAPSPEQRPDTGSRLTDEVSRTTSDIAKHRSGRQSSAGRHRLMLDVLDDFLSRPTEMARAAQLLRDGLRNGFLHPAPPGDDENDNSEEEFSAPEGRTLYRRHRTRERSRALRSRKIATVLRSGGTLACEVCDFDFGAVYGERGEGYIECHHVVPLHEAGEGTTRLSDLALICSNCHCMIHRIAPWPTPAQLRATLR